MFLNGSNIVLLVNFFACLATVLIDLTYAENKQRTLENPDVKSHRKPKISSEFGYNVLNSDQISNHFRQEHRDVNGVVRGSYGFKNPDGLFRLVQYIADNKGFRAHISSNENGIGKQNPAGVSINRFDQQPLFTEDRTRPPISNSRKQSYSQNKLKTANDDNHPRYDFYSPMSNRNHNQHRHDTSLFQDETNAYEYDIGRREFYSSLMHNPVDKLMRTRFNMPNKVRSNSHDIDRYNALRQQHVWDSSPFIPKPSEELLAQDYNMKNLYNSLRVPSVLFNANRPQLSSPNQKHNLRNFFSNYPDDDTGLYRRPQQEVHNSLPDCNYASSAELCKPPLHFGDILPENRNYENKQLFHDVRENQAVQGLSPVEEYYPQNSPQSEFALDLTGDAHNIYPPHMIPNSYPLRSEIYKQIFGNLNRQGESKRDEKNCQKGIFSDGTTSNGYITPSESHSFVDSTGTNDLTSYNTNLQDTSSEQQETSQYSERKNELYTRLIRIIQNDESLNKLRNLLLATDHSSSKTTPKKESPKLSLLGVLILPSNVIKELDYEQNNKKSQTKHVPEDFNEKNVSENTFESATLGEAQHSDQTHETFSTVNYAENTESKNDSFEGDQLVGNDTSRLILDLPLNLTFSKSNIVPKINHKLDFPAETVTSPKLYVYEDQSLLDKEKNSSGVNTDDWRKILEDEISKEIRESAAGQDSSSLDTLLHKYTDSDESKQSGDTQYNFNKHIGPLYDSTGKLIQPENVPIHIHRFNPPSGLASLPWKYAIPRPAPPRSIVVPPKPPTLS